MIKKWIAISIAVLLIGLFSTVALAYKAGISQDPYNTHLRIDGIFDKAVVYGELPITNTFAGFNIGLYAPLFYDLYAGGAIRFHGSPEVTPTHIYGLAGYNFINHPFLSVSAELLVTNPNWTNWTTWEWIPKAVFQFNFNVPTPTTP